MTQDTQFSTREVPWMKLGKLVDQPVTAKEAAKLANLDFTVSLREVYFKNTNFTQYGNITHITGRKAVVADDNNDFMGFVSSSKYHSLQYGEAFSFMDGINPVYVAGGGLRSRRQGFMVAELPTVKNINIVGSDPHQLYVVLRTSHDCSRATEVSVMMLRNRCMNQMTLQSFSKDAVYRWSIKHTSSQAAKLAEAQKSLKNTSAYISSFALTANELVNKLLTGDQARSILRTVIKMPSGQTKRVEAQYEEKIEKIIDLFYNCDEVGYPGTGWGLVNAASEFYEWHRDGGTPESRFIGALEGQTHKVINGVASLVLAA